MFSTINTMIHLDMYLKKLHVKYGFVYKSLNQKNPSLLLLMILFSRMLVSAFALADTIAAMSPCAVQVII